MYRSGRFSYSTSSGSQRLQARNPASRAAAGLGRKRTFSGFAYAFEHLEVAGYAQLARVARRAGDEDTAAVAERIEAEEQSMAERVRAHFDAAVDIVFAERLGG